MVLGQGDRKLANLESLTLGENTKPSEELCISGSRLSKLESEYTLTLYHGIMKPLAGCI